MTTKGQRWRLGRGRRLKPACKNGHPFTPENTRMKAQGKNRNPIRQCIICQREHVRRQNKRFTGMNRGPQKWQKDRSAIQTAWERLLARPDLDYNRRMIEAKAEYDAWVAQLEQRARRQKRGRAA